MQASLLASALRAQGEGVLIAGRRTGPRGLRILFANETLCAMIGRSASELVGRSHGVLHTDNAEVSRVREWISRAGPGSTLAGEGFLNRPDGSTISVAWSFAPLCDRRGRVTHVVATYRDQTEKRQLQEALVHAQRLDAVGRVAGGVAHDFNNLLSVINGYCEILAAHVAANPQALREVAEIHAAGRRAAALTQQLLAFSRRQPLNARTINLGRLVEDNAEILRRLLGNAGRLELRLQDGLANVRTDPTQFQQVLLNLVLNARDALRDDGRVVVSTENREIKPGLNRRSTDTPPGRYVALTVADNGTGMDAEIQKHLFEPFFTTKPEGKGTGLGLALVYGIVQQSGGYITAKSALLVGSTFEILLPAVNAPVEEAAPVVAPLPSLRGNESVVLIEADAVVRKMVEGMLVADGYRVLARASFAEAAAELDDLRPVDLLIGSLAGDGEKYVQRLQAVRPRLRMLSTADHEESSLAAWFPAERRAYIQKPFALSELLRAARKLLDA